MVREVGRARIPWWQMLRVLLVLGWVAWAGLTWWTSPRQSDTEQVRADLAAGRLTHYEWGDGFQKDGGGLVSPFPATLEPTGGPGPILLWHTGDGRQYFTVTDASGAGSRSSDGNLPLYSGPEATALDAELQAYDARPAGGPEPSTAVAALAIGGGVLFLWALLSAPDPVKGTRWFWFWLVCGVPLGLGLLWWLARERPWSPRTEPRFGPPGRDNRLRWWAGIGVAVLAGFTVSLTLIGLRNLLGEDLVPSAR